MWVLKLETSHENTILANLAKQYSINFSGYPISYHESRNGLFVQVCGFIEGSQIEIKDFVEKLKYRPMIKKLYCNKDFIIARVKLPKWLVVLYTPEIIFIEPAKYDKDGTEKLMLASWNKEPLMKLVKVFKNKYKSRILTFAQKKVDNISLISVHPNLTDKQKLALRLAVKHGYYEFPKKITLKQLAKLMGVSFSTFQAHLSKAESNFIPQMFGRFITSGIYRQ